jgi:hypothetical protein
LKFDEEALAPMYKLLWSVPGTEHYMFALIPFGVIDHVCKKLAGAENASVKLDEQAPAVVQAAAGRARYSNIFRLKSVAGAAC